MYLLWIMVIFLLPYFYRLLRGPSIWDRFLGLNLISTKIIIISICYASINNSAFILDFAIVYTLLTFICIIFTALFLQDRMKKGGN